MGAFGIGNTMILASFPRTLQISINSRCQTSVRQTYPWLPELFVPRDKKKVGTPHSRFEPPIAERKA